MEEKGGKPAEEEREGALGGAVADAPQSCLGGLGQEEGWSACFHALLYALRKQTRWLEDLCFFVLEAGKSRILGVSRLGV